LFRDCPFKNCLASPPFILSFLYDIILAEKLQVYLSLLGVCVQKHLNYKNDLGEVKGEGKVFCNYFLKRRA